MLMMLIAIVAIPIGMVIFVALIAFIVKCFLTMKMKKIKSVESANFEEVAKTINEKLKEKNNY